MKQVVRMEVVHGGAGGVSPWLDFPALVRGRLQKDPSAYCLVRISSDFALKSARASRRQPAFELWSCILKRPPPINNIEYKANKPIYEGLSALEDAHACFKGLKRPIAEDDDGENWLTFVIKPSAYYRFDNTYPGAMVCVGRRLPVPDDLVFLAHVRLDHPCRSEHEPVIGALTHWGFTEVSGDDHLLPVGHASRFHVRVW